MNDIVLMSAIAAHNAAGDVGTQTDRMLATNAAIQTAVTSNTYTCTVSVSGWKSDDLQWVLEQLQIKGYTRSVTTTTLTITWSF